VDYAETRAGLVNPVQSGLRELANINFLRGNFELAIEQQLEAIMVALSKESSAQPAWNV
jgi:hypothetical protein